MILAILSVALSVFKNRFDPNQIWDPVDLTLSVVQYILLEAVQLILQGISWKELQLVLEDWLCSHKVWDSVSAIFGL